MTTVDTGVEKGGQSEEFLTTQYEAYVRRAGTGILKVAWEGVRSVRTAEFETANMGYEEGRAVCKSSKRLPTVVLWVSSAVPSCSADEKPFDMLEKVRVYKVDVKS